LFAKAIITGICNWIPSYKEKHHIIPRGHWSNLTWFLISLALFKIVLSPQFPKIWLALEEGSPALCFISITQARSEPDYLPSKGRKPTWPTFGKRLHGQVKVPSPVHVPPVVLESQKEAWRCTQLQGAQKIDASVLFQLFHLDHSEAGGLRGWICPSWYSGPLAQHVILNHTTYSHYHD
jgi:hypothetical protein